MARAAPRTSRQRGGERGRGGGSQLHRVRTALAQRLAPLCDPTNMAAHAAVAAVLLAAEAVLCLLIIRRIPCAWAGCLPRLAAANLLPAHLAEPPTVNAVVWPSARSDAWHAWRQPGHCVPAAAQTRRLTGRRTCRRWAATCRCGPVCLADALPAPFYVGCVVQCRVGGYLQVRPCCLHVSG